MPQKVYLNDQGLPKQYLDESGNLIKQTTSPEQQKVPQTIREAADYKVKFPGTNYEFSALDAGKNIAVGGISAGLGSEAAPVASQLLSRLPGLAKVTPTMVKGPISSTIMSLINNLSEGKTNPNDIATDALTYEGVGKATEFTAGKLANMGYNAYKEMTKPGSIIDKYFPGLRQYGPVASAYGSTPMQHPILKGIEDLFAPVKKEQSLNATTLKVKSRANQLLQNITSRASTSLEDQEELAQLIQKQAFETFRAYKNVSNLKGGIFLSEATRNQYAAPIFRQTPGLMQAGQQLPPQMQQVGTHMVEGAIVPTGLIGEVNSMIGELEQSKVKPDPNNPVIKALYDIKNSFQFINPQTGEVFYKPTWSARDAWETKKVLDELGYEGVNYQNQTIRDVRFQRLSKALNQDIENSINDPNLWKVNANKARDAWLSSKELTRQRHDLFGAEKETGQSVYELVNKIKDRKVPIQTVQSPVDTLNAIIDDPNKLNNFLLTEKSPVDAATGVTYIFDNKRRDLQGYEFMRLVNKSLTQDPKNPANQIIDSNKLFSQLNDPNKAASYKILFSANNRSDIEQFFNNIAQVSQKVSGEGQRYTLLRLSTYGVGLSSMLGSAMLGNSMPVSGVLGPASFAGATLSFQALAKLLTNKDTARLMVAAAQNSPLQMPIGMAGRIIANVIKNTPITLNYSDGNSIEGKINAEGKFEVSINKPNSK